MKDPLDNGVIAVIGMHRSGTSMIAGLLHACGLFLGSEDRLLPPHETNRMGFFEHEDFVNINERILAHFGGSWHAPPPLEGRWYADPALAPLAEEARVLIASFPMNEVWGFKDPRTTILLPFWRRLIPDLRFVVCMRNPLEVGKSLLRRDDIPVPRGAWLWERYVTAALRGTEGAPRCIVYFDEFFKGPVCAARRMVEFCGLAWPEDAKWVGKAIRSDLHHQQVGLRELFEEDDLPARVKILYLMTLAVCRDGYGAGGAGDDDVKEDRLSALADFVQQMGEENALLRTERRLGETMTALADNERALAGSVSKVSSLQEIIAQKDVFTDEIKKLHGKLLEDKERQFIAANDALARKQIELDELALKNNRVMNENAQQLARIKREYEDIFADRDRQLSELREILKEKETRFEALERESRDLILKKDAEIRDKTAALNDSYKNEEKLKVEIDNLLKQIEHNEQLAKNIAEESKNHLLRVSELENSVFEKENEIKEAEQTNSLKTQLLVRQNKAILALSERTRNQETVLRIKDQYCRNIENEIRSKIEIIKSRENVIREKDSQHAHDNEMLASAGREIAESRVKGRSLETQIENLNRLIRVMEVDINKKKRKIAELETLVSVHEKELRDFIEKSEQMTQALTADIFEKERKIAELETLLAEHAETLRNIFDSQSWKAVRFYGKIKEFFLS